MRLLRSALLAVFAASFLWLALLVLAQQNPPQLTPEQEAAAAKAQQMAEVMAVVKKQFGPDLEIAETPSKVGAKYLHPDMQKTAKWSYLVTGDLNSDGSEDAAIVVRFKNPLGRQAQYNYTVVDPYFSHGGYGNPKVTVEFMTEDPRYQNMVLVIHGAGKEGWRADTPKEKFVIINMPFEKLEIGSVMVKKKKMMAIIAEESDGNASAVFWDGKKYRWVDTSGLGS